MDPCYPGVFFAETPGVVHGWGFEAAPQRKGTEDPQGLQEVQWALQRQLGQLIEEQRALVKFLRTEFRRRGDRLGRRRAGTRRPTAERRTCYACARRGHIKRDCPYWAGSRMPHPEKGQRQVPRAACRVREPRQLPACWTCGQTGHFWRDCPGPERDSEKKQGARAIPRRGACWHCRERGHQKKDCPLVGRATQLEAVERVADRPVGHPGEVVKTAAGMVGTLREGQTQTITREVINKETQTEWGRQEAGVQKRQVLETKWTQVVMGQATKEPRP
ncbi:uncharacterized protein LOC120393050 [Mauremys reevesii]|uniref:uncharacterized protein LOC120393050 n=1 Tax=Mauremys reevesii TaxID=260615 RepID=UPI001940006B|nr:uncharacterized protein LOC120393050 [Mauremys reevesii]